MFDPDRLFPQLFANHLDWGPPDEDLSVPKHIRDGNIVVEREFVPGVHINILYQDDPEFARFVCRRDLKEWGLSEVAAFELADRNLDEQISGAVTLKRWHDDTKDVTFFEVEDGGQFAAALVRSQRFWNDYNIDQSSIAAIIPDQLTLQFVNKHFEGNLPYLKQLLSEHLEEPSGKPCFDGILVSSPQTAGLWAALEGPNNN